jgi:hypothetical protein
LFDQRGGQPFADLLAKGCRTSRAAVVELTVEGDHHAAGIIARQRGQNGADRPLADRADRVRSARGAQVRSTSM